MSVNLSARDIVPSELPRTSSAFETCMLALLAVVMAAVLFCIYTFA
ncbi:MAG: hypothetical protein JO108_36565 [Acidobacteriaceae bacterium]|nr:hypothetical protein [Acidobacteriaceae bacterium]